MNKAEFVAQLQNKLGCSKQKASEAMDGVFEVLTENLQNAGSKVKVYGFGTFECRERPAHVARNPRTGGAVHVPPRKGIYFKASKTLVD